MPATLAELAALVGGECRGDANLHFTSAAPLDDAGASDITLIDHRDKLPRLGSSPAWAAIVPREVTDADLAALPREAGAPLAVLRVANPHEAFEAVVRHFRPAPPRAWRGVSPDARVAASARLAPDATVGPLATIGEGVELAAGVVVHAGAHLMAGCKIGEACEIFPQVTLYENTLVGPRCVIHAGAVIGAYGFGYRQVDGRHVRAAQLGYVELEADVEVGANATIDRGSYGRTLIGAGTKIDNQVQVAHNCRIGRHNLLCAQVGVAGSTSTGDYVVLAGQVGVRDHVHIGARAVISAMAGITNNVPEGATLAGLPATPVREQWMMQASFKKLPELRKQVRELLARVEQLEAQGDLRRNSAA